MLLLYVKESPDASVPIGSRTVRTVGISDTASVQAWRRMAGSCGNLRSAVDSGRGGLVPGNEEQFGREKVNLALGKLILQRVQADVHAHLPACPVYNQFLFSL